jgi:serine phosphatase RsbU (regulator of sigma subunit)
MDRSAADRWLGWLILPASAVMIISALTWSGTAYTGVSVSGSRVEVVESGSPGDLAGLRPGDVLLAADPSAGVSSLSPNPLQGAAPGRPLVVRAQREGRTRLVWIAPAPLPESERRFRAFLFVVACGFLLLGGWVWSERRDKLTRTFLVLCLAFGGMLTPQPHFDSAWWRTAYDLGFLAAQVAVPVVFAHFFSLFPEPADHRRERLGIRVGYGIAIGLWLAGLGVAIGDRFGGRGAALLPVLQIGGLVLFAAGMLGGLGLFAASFLRVTSADARRRLRVAFFGTLLGAAPFVLVTAWRNMRPGVPLPGERLSVAATLLVPASFAWAIAVHRVFDFRVALRAITVVVIAALSATLLYFAGEWLAASWGPSLGEGVSGVSLAFLALVAALAGPARPLLSGLGARVVPIKDEVSLAEWMPTREGGGAADAERVLQEACEQLVRALRLDGCAALRTVDARPRPVAFAGARLIPALGAGFLEALHRVHGPREIALLDVAPEDRDTLEMAGVHWVVPVPGTPAPAVLLLGRRLTGSWLDRAEARDLEQLTQHLAVALENSELRREARSRVALDRELAEAHHVQVTRLPRRTPVYPTLDCAAATLSVESVGGDYYDFIEIAPRDFTLAVGDAAGHGVPAALVLAGVQSRFRAEAQRARHPGDLLEALNRDLVALDQPEKFVGLLCARVDVSAGIVRFANAGLTPPLVRRADGRLEELRESGMLLGVSEAARYGVASVELDAGDVAVVYTDGLTEASRGNRMFGVEGVQEVLDQHAHRRASDIVEELLAAVRDWADEPLDDLTIVVLRQLTRPGSRPRGGSQRPIKSGHRSADITA